MVDSAMADSEFTETGQDNRKAKPRRARAATNNPQLQQQVRSAMQSLEAVRTQLEKLSSTWACSRLL
eukprot:12895214-Prorocentrum_lima.AAC.1